MESVETTDPHPGCIHSLKAVVSMCAFMGIDPRYLKRYPLRQLASPDRLDTVRCTCVGTDASRRDITSVPAHVSYDWQRIIVHAAAMKHDWSNTEPLVELRAGYVGLLRNHSFHGLVKKNKTVKSINSSSQPQPFDRKRRRSTKHVIICIQTGTTHHQKMYPQKRGGRKTCNLKRKAAAIQTCSKNKASRQHH